MKQKYLEWIESNVPSDETGFGNAGKCLEFSSRMVEAFPELILCKGVVFSRSNPDNYTRANYKEYLHAWVQTQDGTIFDPTKNQFALLGELEYMRFPDDVDQVEKCINCGRYFYDGYVLCSGCK